MQCLEVSGAVRPIYVSLGVKGLRNIGIYETSEGTICQMPDSTMDEEHLLHCRKPGTDQQVLKNTIKLYWDAGAMMR